MSLTEIQDKVKEADYRFSDHAVKRMIERSIERTEIEEAIMNGEVIEEYPKVVVITAYQPDSDEWIDSRVRRTTI